MTVPTLLIRWTFSSNFNFRNIISTFEKEREHTKKTIEQIKKQGDAYMRERDIVRKELVKWNSKMKNGSRHSFFLISLKSFLFLIHS